MRGIKIIKVKNLINYIQSLSKKISPTPTKVNPILSKAMNINGVLFKSGDIQDLIKKINKMIMDPNLLGSLKEKAYENYLNLYNKKKNYEILINIYNETIKNYLK